MPLDPEEPQKVAEAVQLLGLGYAVLTSVARDDLPDGVRVGLQGRSPKSAFLTRILKLRY